MANSYNTNPIYLDDFTSAIDLADHLRHARRPIHSIEWSKPTDTTHTCVIRAGGASGPPVFDEQCTTAYQSIIKYFPNKEIDALYLSAATATEKASGAIIITLR